MTTTYHAKADRALNALTMIAAVASGHPMGDVARVAVIRGMEAMKAERDFAAAVIAEAALLRISRNEALKGTDVGLFAHSSLREMDA